jgi:LmbE family N-acetylglucosaminyl deacetylase
METVETMHIVAHPDDSLLFQSPQLLKKVESGTGALTVHLCAGDSGQPEQYWRQREAGIEASYAEMAGVPNEWAKTVLRIGSRAIPFNVLTPRPNILLAFMRLPDGGHEAGTGSARYGHQSLTRLWETTKPCITSVDRTVSYTKQDLIDTLASMMDVFTPELIAVMDYVNAFTPGDHMDHYASARFSLAAHELYHSPHRLVGYAGYRVESLAENIDGDLLRRKQSVFYVYGRHDQWACSSDASCAGTPYAEWLKREYTIGSETIGVVADAGWAQTAKVGSTVCLDASGSSGQGSEPLRFSWSQDAGPTVELSSANESDPTFIAPGTPSILRFSLRVTQGASVSKPSCVAVTVD